MVNVLTNNQQIENIHALKFIQKNVHEIEAFCIIVPMLVTFWCGAGQLNEVQQYPDFNHFVN